MSMLLDAADLAVRLAAAGVRQAVQVLCPDAGAAVAAAAGMAGPVALKLISPDLVHKSDVGGVRLGLSEPGQVRAAAAGLAALAAELGLGRWQLLVQQMVPACEAEIFVGLKRDAVFGPIVVVGAGGRLVELLPSVALQTAPVSVDRARAMLREVPAGRVLDGYRGAARPRGYAEPDDRAHGGILGSRSTHKLLAVLPGGMGSARDLGGVDGGAGGGGDCASCDLGPKSGA